MSDESARETGTVKAWNDRGFGFIARRGGGRDVFVHAAAIAGEGRNSLMVGQSVSFEVIENNRGPRAIEVRPC